MVAKKREICSLFLIRECIFGYVWLMLVFVSTSLLKVEELQYEIYLWLHVPNLERQ